MSPRQVGFTARPRSSRVENEPGAAPEVPTRRQKPSGVLEAGEVEALAVRRSRLSTQLLPLTAEGTNCPRKPVCLQETYLSCLIKATQTPRLPSQQHRPGVLCTGGRVGAWRTVSLQRPGLWGLGGLSPRFWKSALPDP